ncbi:hypothetical protein ACJRO7_004093 [Eucalyptus globulus]|uniref:DUF4220 domain-containing protein n=1 Tax=Eucalyptus globulus TaxID=34317 RepID=A0ABD3IVY1_EUCGL
MKILAEAKNLWMKLNLRGAILMSLSLQVFLIFFAPIRKRCSNKWIVRFTWSAYLLADLVANYALGLMTKAQFTDGTSESKADAYGDLMAFWAPFLLLHLGGPDTITAFALEDNELWLRHLFNLLFQLGAAGYVFYQSLPRNKLIVPTILMFIGGTTKYIERTRALYLASFSKFRNSLFTSLDAGPNYAKLMEEYTAKNKANIPVSIEVMLEPNLEPLDPEKEHITTNLEAGEVINAFSFFTTFKGLLVDLIFSFRERNESMKFFRSMTANDAFRVIEAELNFFYDVLYTKAAAVHCRTGYLFRAISIGSINTAFALFHILNKRGFHESDIQITYALLLGAVGLEFVALSMLICSDWTIALLERSEKHGRRSSIGSTFIIFLLKFKSDCSRFALHILHGRWSESISQRNLIDSRLRRWPKWIEKLLDLIPLGEFLEDLREFLEDLKTGRVEPFNHKLGELIFNKLKWKSMDAYDPERIKEMCASRGKWTLDKSKALGDCENLLLRTLDVDYGESLLTWHIATELCYSSTNGSTYYHRETSMVLSDYMLHLMIKLPNMMSAEVGIWQIRFRDTCAEMDKLISEIFFDGGKTNITKKDVCAHLLSVPTDVEPAIVKGNRVKSVLFDACILAKNLQTIPDKDMWEIMSGVWVELLTYAAIHCRPHVHAQQLSKGGELVTLVWLLTVHLGLSELFQPIEDPKARLIVNK